MKSRVSSALALHALAALVLMGLGLLAQHLWAEDLLSALERRGWQIASPEYLWLLALIPVLLVVRAFSLSDLPAGQQALSFVLRAGVVISLVLSMIDPQILDSEPVSSATVFVVDVSESMPDAALERAHRRVEEAWSLRGRHEVRLVRFAKEAEEVVLPSTTSESIAPLQRMEGELGRASDLEAALDLAFDPAMLAWPKGPKACDGLWAYHWYDAVHESTGLTPTPPRPLGPVARAWGLKRPGRILPSRRRCLTPFE